MKTTRIRNLLLLGLLALSGCTHQYVMSLTNGTRITAASKPRLEGGTYYYKDPSGHAASIPAGRVREISPASMVTDEKARFKSSVTK